MFLQTVPTAVPNPVLKGTNQTNQSLLAKTGVQIA